MAVVGSWHWQDGMAVDRQQERQDRQQQGGSEHQNGEETGKIVGHSCKRSRAVHMVTAPPTAGCTALESGLQALGALLACNPGPRRNHHDDSNDALGARGCVV